MDPPFFFFFFLFNYFPPEFSRSTRCNASSQIVRSFRTHYLHRSHSKGTLPGFCSVVRRHLPSSIFSTRRLIATLLFSTFDPFPALCFLPSHYLLLLLMVLYHRTADESFLVILERRILASSDLIPLVLSSRSCHAYIHIWFISVKTIASIVSSTLPSFRPL
jgi:hypothetical protein